MGGVDAIVFTGGIGENDAASREEIMKDMEWLGIDFDFEKNRSVKSQENIITREDSKVKVMVIPTNEELVIASDTYEIVTRNLEMI